VYFQESSAPRFSVKSTITTGISILAFAPSALFRIYYFRMYIIMIVLCGFYGLLFLPAYLGLVGGNLTPKDLAEGDEWAKLRNSSSNSLVNMPLSIQGSDSMARN
jgi:hypothetical protein